MIERLKYFFSLIGLNRKYSVWEHGTCNKTPARRHKINGNVQFVLWKAGQQGYKEDCWHNYYSSWWKFFEPDKK